MWNSVLTSIARAALGTKKAITPATIPDAGRPGPGVRLTLPPMSKRTVKRKLRTKKKANHGKKPNCGRG